MRPYKYELGQFAAGNVAAIAAAQAVTANGDMTLTSDPYVQDVPRTVLLTFAASEVANRFVIKGTGPKGNEIIEALAGTATIAETVRVFSTVTSITAEIAGAGNVSAGTLNVVPTPWFPLDYVRVDFNVGVLLEQVGTVVAGSTLEATKDQLGWNNADPIKGGHHGSLFDMIHPIQTIEDITTEVLGAATIGTGILASGKLARHVTAIRALTGEALGAGELLRLQIVQGHTYGGS